MKVFVSGGTGYIGSQLIKKLLQTDHEVVALYRGDTPAVEHKNLSWKKGSLDDPQSLTELLKGCKGVYHSAALAKMWHKKKNAFFDVNVNGTKHLIQAAKESGVENFVFTSSAVVMSSSVSTPVVESDPLVEPLDEEYAVTKYLAERLVMQAAEPGFKTVVVNPPRVYGPSDAGFSAVNNLAKNYLKNAFYFMPGNGSYIGNYVYIDDVVNGHMAAMQKGVSSHRYILGGENHSYVSVFDTLEQLTSKKRKGIGVPFTMMKLVAVAEETKAKLTGFAPWITIPMVRKLFSHRELSSDKAVKEIDYKMTSLAEGLEKTIASFSFKK
jgi:nucleoside-diphosphate-sugar epimerase